MQFIVIARDKKDADALQRRLAAREAHVALGDEMVKNSQALFGAAMLDENKNMNGSMYVVDFPSRAELDAWLQEEPYVTGDVWGEIEVIPCQVGPSFQK